MENKHWFHTGDLVTGYCHYKHTEVCGIIIDDDVFHEVNVWEQYVKVRWTDGKVTIRTSNTLGMVKVREQ